MTRTRPALLASCLPCLPCLARLGLSLFALLLTGCDQAEIGAEASTEKGVAQAAVFEHGRLGKKDETLETGEYFDLVTFSGNAGDYVELDLTSNDFGPYLIVTTPQDETFENDDDEGSATRSR